MVVVEELERVGRLLLRKSQMDSIRPDYQALTAVKSMAASDHLNKISPFLDDQNFISLRRRLRQVQARYDMKHPILFYAKHPIVRKLIQDAHKTISHEKTEYVRSNLQQIFRTIGFQNVLRSETEVCLVQKATGWKSSTFHDRPT